ncbi:DegT/DnrJ/EryC1/StrS family aminotransferase [Faecalicatena contorta]|uniref:dTDP-4-amino-4,6-dideoxygalactose transaminase n=1 Tax=Faecalicatena contorta TaxID=39482 RepID=A0A315ZRP4_9FIRM|nr:DegT/DnrJ/EryC1/StrS family aminotransferase [Faecalicatena contorta]PWJ48205.1 dTDP-4-amino-4,6-dideoxygalactose transaminase [Faecalicatena contorta]SUQ15481.1 dTDP-4-amino-4,6-dideoxygalactose transaminase [Faecalicatena contorta]
MKIPFSPPDITEEEITEVAETLRSGWITTGPRAKEFECRIAEYCHTRKAVCLNSATACLEMTLHVMGIGPGDEVITTAYTYSATASCICHVGAMPVLVDTLPGSYEMDPQKVREAVTERTKAIISVDLGGVIYSRYDEIFRIVEEKRPIFSPSNEKQEALGRILIIADAAHAFGAWRDGKICGQIADFTCFSFHAVKNLTTAEGGAVTWSHAIAQAGLDEEKLYKEYMLLSLHGQSKDALEKTQAGAWEYDIVAPYYKCNMTDIMAAIGLVQLKRYPEILKRRRSLIEQYNKGLDGCPVEVLNHYGEDMQSSGHLYLVRVLDKTRQECNNIINELAKSGIASNVHYKPLPMLTAYSQMGFDVKDYPNAYAQFENEITLPLHTCLTDEQVEYVAGTFRRLVI